MEEGKSASTIPNNDSDEESHAAKRQRICNGKDEIIGLEFPDGRLYWCPRSTMTNASGSYFAARFGTDGHHLSAGAVHIGEHGRSVYFIARDGELFEKYILQFLLTNRPGQLPPFAKAPELWRALREEAKFYALDGLYDILYVTHTCEPNPDGRGTLYWVGTDKGMRKEYKNPHSSGAVYVGGWSEDAREALERTAVANGVLIFPFQARSKASRNALVEYRPPVIGLTEPNPTGNRLLYAANTCFNLWCGHSFHRLPTVLDLKTLSVRLTHYSLRYDMCGMSHWNLEGSLDGTEWDALHEARGDPHMHKPSSEALTRLKEMAVDGASDGTVSDEVVSEILLEFAEREYRHTWAIDPPTTTFYRYFRIIGIGEEHEGCQCLHGVGLELYGDIHEE